MSKGSGKGSSYTSNATRGLLDTSTVIAIETGRDVDYGALPLQQYVCVITLGELNAGIHTAPDVEARASRVASLATVSGLQTLPITDAAARHWGRLRARLLEAKRRLNVNDLWIASVALANDLPVVTQDADFDVLADLGGPQVIKV
ncbi:MAG TPA: type II toxin-antitoxin system VapC family toxin [Terrimesophilobacter sp.]|nr:type II toxin-antitoxin system VapC family toxin [Terrimesophilobacter sp.]